MSGIAGNHAADDDPHFCFEPMHHVKGASGLEPLVFPLAIKASLYYAFFHNVDFGVRPPPNLTRLFPGEMTNLKLV
jgi:hypothetical protein